jgi:rubrerythrin
MQKVADLELESSQTFENLKKAFYDEASLAFRYRFFSIVADFEGMDQYSALFKEFAEGGVQTVHGCLDFLRIVGEMVVLHPMIVLICRSSELEKPKLMEKKSLSSC